MTGSWYRFDAGSLPRGVVVVEAMKESAALWQGPVASILELLAEKLPANQQPDVVFLGDNRTHPLDVVLRGLSAESKPTRAALDVECELGRYPVIGPLLWALQQDLRHDVPVLVISTRPVIDL